MYNIRVSTLLVFIHCQFKIINFIVVADLAVYATNHTTSWLSVKFKILQAHRHGRVLSMIRHRRARRRKIDTSITGRQNITSPNILCS